MLKYRIPQIVTLTRILTIFHTYLYLLSCFQLERTGDICEVLQTKRLYSLRNEPLSLWTSLGLNQGPPDYEALN